MGNTPIQEVYAGKNFYKCDIAVVMTNSFFTPKAIELAQSTGVLLWDRQKLEEMMEYVGYENIDGYKYKSLKRLSNNEEAEYIENYDLDDEELKAKNLCFTLKKNIIVDTECIEQMDIEFKHNLITSYTSLQMNFEIKNTKGKTFDTGIVIKVMFYDGNDNLLHMDDAYIGEKDISRKRYTDYFYFDTDDINKASRIEVDIYEED